MATLCPGAERSDAAELSLGSILRAFAPEDFDALLPALGKRWKIYIRPPFAGPSQILRYLSNYTHRVALSNRRIIARDERNQTVTLTYRDYRDGSRIKPLKLPLREFIGRFALHILPPGLVRIRHYGILANNRRKRDVLAARQILARRRRPSAAEPQCTLPPDLPLRCPRCGEAALRLIGFCDRHGAFHPLRKHVAHVAYLDSS